MLLFGLHLRNLLVKCWDIQFCKEGLIFYGSSSARYSAFTLGNTEILVLVNSWILNDFVDLPMHGCRRLSRIFCKNLKHKFLEIICFLFSKIVYFYNTFKVNKSIDLMLNIHNSNIPALDISWKEKVIGGFILHSKIFLETGSNRFRHVNLNRCYFYS